MLKLYSIASVDVLIQNGLKFQWKIQHNYSQDMSNHITTKANTTLPKHKILKQVLM